MEFDGAYLAALGKVDVIVIRITGEAGYLKADGMWILLSLWLILAIDTSPILYKFGQPVKIGFLSHY